MNGSNRGRQQEKVRVAIIGVGNCANSFMQGLTYYKDAKPDEFVPGLMHVDLGGYHIKDPPTTRSSSPMSRRPASPSTAA